MVRKVGREEEEQGGRRKKEGRRRKGDQTNQTDEEKPRDQETHGSQRDASGVVERKTPSQNGPQKTTHKQTNMHKMDG